jgi:hypothetical protein
VKLTYDIFRKLPERAPIWIEAVQTLELVKTRLATLSKTHPGEYIVYDFSRNQFVAFGADSLEIIGTARVSCGP